jgi:hypothetical protein
VDLELLQEPLEPPEPLAALPVLVEPRLRTPWSAVERAGVGLVDRRELLPRVGAVVEA